MSTREQAIEAEARYIAYLYESFPSPENLERIRERLANVYDHGRPSPNTHKAVPKDAIVIEDWPPGPLHLKGLLILLRENHWDYLADQIEAQTKPPRIPEPGLWGVVEAGHKHLDDGRRSQFVRVATTGRAQWVEREAEADWCTWDALVDPVLVRDGIE